MTHSTGHDSAGARKARSASIVVVDILEYSIMEVGEGEGEGQWVHLILKKRRKNDFRNWWTADGCEIEIFLSFLSGFRIINESILKCRWKISWGIKRSLGTFENWKKLKKWQKWLMSDAIWLEIDEILSIFFRFLINWTFIRRKSKFIDYIKKKCWNVYWWDDYVGSVLIWRYLKWIGINQWLWHIPSRMSCLVIAVLYLSNTQKR